MNQLIQDVRYALRQLRKAPGFAVTAVLTLALGIGATATMYSVVRDALLAPLPYPEHDRLVGVGFTFPQEKPNAEEMGSSADFVKAHSRSFSSVGVAEDSSFGANLSGAAGGNAARVSSTGVSQGYFSTLGVTPILGRNFTAEEDLPGGPNVAILSYWVWQRTFGGDSGIVDRVVRINEAAYTVVGVMPKEISGSPAAQGAANAGGVWLPLRLNPKDPGYEGDNYIMVARLRPGVEVAQAQQEMDGLKTPFYAQFPSYKTWTSKAKLLHEFRVWPLQTVLVSDVRQSLLVLFGAVLAVLLVACLNLAGLMTARAAARERELALRTALGATRGRILGLLLCESLVLATVGGGLGLGLARIARPALLAASPLAIPVQTYESYWGIVGFVMGVALLTTLVCGLLPGWTVFRKDAQTALAGGQAAGASASQVRMGKSLMVGQVAVAMVLLSAACLLLGSFLKLRSTPSGVEAKRLEIAQVSLKGPAYATTLHTTQFVDKVTSELQSCPGVQQVAAVNGLPLDRGLNMGGAPADRPQMSQTIEFRAVTPGYFRTLGIPLMMGRDVTAGDGPATPKVVLVSETGARKWWPGKSPIGERVVFGTGAPCLIVGVVADTKSHSLAEPPEVMFYAPFAQMPDEMTKMVNGWFSTTFAIRLSGDVDIATAVQKAVSDADPEMPVAKLTPMQGVIDDTVAAPRFFSWMAGGFAVFAVLLTVVGLFGLLSYQVTQRTREIGVRLAIGSSRSGILLLILRRGLMLTAIGLALGGVASLAVPRLVASVLADNVFTGGATIDSALSSSAAALAMAAVAMLFAAVLASFLPARRAAAAEPMQALRAE
ncbi:MAG TPA: ABC transporter permease [Acidobacteriaceae bacterium]